MNYATMPLADLMRSLFGKTFHDAGLTQRLVRELRNALTKIDDLAEQIGELQRRISDMGADRRDIQLGMCVGILRTVRAGLCNENLARMIDNLFKEMERP